MGVKVNTLQNVTEVVDREASTCKVTPPGETIEVDANQVDRLVAAGVVEKIGK